MAISAEKEKTTSAKETSKDNIKVFQGQVFMLKELIQAKIRREEKRKLKRKEKLERNERLRDTNELRETETQKK